MDKKGWIKYGCNSISSIALIVSPGIMKISAHNLSPGWGR
jgi:hypothetical protein